MLCYKAPCLGKATLAQWIEAILESEQLLEESESGEEEASPREEEAEEADEEKTEQQTPIQESEEEAFVTCEDTAVQESHPKT